MSHMSTVTILDERTITREFAARLVYARHHRGLSQNAAVRRSPGLSSGRLSTIENAVHSDVLLPTLVRVALSVDVSLEWLLGLEAPEPPFYPTRSGAMTPETVGAVFGSRLRERRLACGLNQARLAQWSATTATQVGQFELYPSRSCHLSTLHRLAAALNTTPWALLGEEDRR